MKAPTKHQVLVAFIEKSGWGNNKVHTLRYCPFIMLKKLYNLNELGHMLEQSLLYLCMTSKLQRFGDHGNRLHFVICKTKMSLKTLIMKKVVI